MHELKKYPNRRLYDVTDSKHVTIDDVRMLISGGESIRVLDSKSGADLTRAVLMQILSEQESEGHASVLTNRVIEQLIRFFGDSSSGAVSGYIEQSIVAFLEHQSQLRNHLRQMNDLNPFSRVQKAFGSTTPTVATRAEIAPAGLDDSVSADPPPPAEQETKQSDGSKKKSRKKRDREKEAGKKRAGKTGEQKKTG